MNVPREPAATMPPGSDPPFCARLRGERPHRHLYRSGQGPQAVSPPRAKALAETPRTNPRAVQLPKLCAMCSATSKCHQVSPRDFLPEVSVRPEKVAGQRIEFKGSAYHWPTAPTFGIDW
jgi:hypothetical protein